MSEKDAKMDEIIENAFVKSLRQHGFLFPATQTDLEAIKNKKEIGEVPLPSDLENPMQIIERGKIKSISSGDFPDNSEVEENLARAAREGKDIPDDVKNQMKKDKDSSKRKDIDEDSKQ
jgi:hypothetical protein